MESKIEKKHKVDSNHRPLTWLATLHQLSHHILQTEENDSNIYPLYLSFRDVIGCLLLCARTPGMVPGTRIPGPPPASGYWPPASGHLPRRALQHFLGWEIVRKLAPILKCHGLTINNSLCHIQTVKGAYSIKHVMSGGRKSGNARRVHCANASECPPSPAFAHPQPPSEDAGTDTNV